MEWSRPSSAASDNTLVGSSIIKTSAPCKSDSLNDSAIANSPPNDATNDANIP